MPWRRKSAKTAARHNALWVVISQTLVCLKPATMVQNQAIQA